MTDKKLPISDWLKPRLWDVQFTRGDQDYEDDEPDRTEVTDIGQAKAVSSEVTGGIAFSNGQPLHMVMLDLDMPAHLVPSSTPGHSHLYIEAVMDWPRYEALLWALAEAGVIERGYAEVSIKRQATFLRLPWVRKDQPDLPAPQPEEAF